VDRARRDWLKEAERLPERRSADETRELSMFRWRWFALQDWIA
jgi:hypothetical protein